MKHFIIRMWFRLLFVATEPIGVLASVENRLKSPIYFFERKISDDILLVRETWRRRSEGHSTSYREVVAEWYEEREAKSKLTNEDQSTN